jgi:hypothetical protein
MSLGSNWVDRVRSLRKIPMAQTFALIAPVLPFSPLCIEFCAVTRQSKMHPKTTKRTKTRVKGPMGWIGWIRCKKFRCDFVAQSCAFIAPVQPILHRVSFGNETLPSAPKHYETNQNKSLGSNGVDRVDSLQKNPMRIRGTDFCINCSSSACFAPSFMQ